MQVANVPTLQRYHDRLNEANEPPVELFHPDVEIHMFAGSPIFTGLEANFPLAVLGPLP